MMIHMACQLPLETPCQGRVRATSGPCPGCVLVASGPCQDRATATPSRAMAASGPPRIQKRISLAPRRFPWLCQRRVRPCQGCTKHARAALWLALCTYIVACFLCSLGRQRLISNIGTGSIRYIYPFNTSYLFLCMFLGMRATCLAVRPSSAPPGLRLPS